jgi:hypothetical protein
MYLFDFKSKLKRLNPSLYVMEDAAARIDSEFRVGSICLPPKRSAGLSAADRGAANSQETRFFDDSAAGFMPDIICGVPVPYVPEHDLFNLETGKLRARGWRSILKILISRGICSVERAQKVFGFSFDAYDRLNETERLKWARGERFARSSQLVINEPTKKTSLLLP